MLEAFGFSDPGCVRKNNEDFFLISPHTGLYLVADGMGGAQAGEHASQLAAETVDEIVSWATSRDENLLRRAFEEANRRVLGAAHSDPLLDGMGTTLVAMLDAGSHAYIASVGDSRAYIFHQDRLVPVTEDQTWVEEVGKKLGLEDQQLKRHPMRHVLTMAIGAAEALRIQSYQVELERGMKFLICSDGLHGVLDDEAIRDAFSAPADLKLITERLIDKAREAGGPDNITAVLLEVP